MKGAGRWTIAGLLCLCGVFGCAQLPSRGLFARQIKPPTDESRTEEHSDLADEDTASFMTDANWNRDLAVGSRPDRDPVAAAISGRLDADVSPLDGNEPTSGSVVEAPSPNRRSSPPPGTFVVPPNAREIASNSDPIPNNRFSDQGSIVLANHETLARENSSDIELTAGQRRSAAGAAGTPNPWERFRGLTNNHDAGNPTTKDSLIPTLPSNQTPSLPRTEQPRFNGDLPNDNPAGSPPAAQGIAQPQPWPEASSQSVRSDTINAPNSPELWPRAPGNWNTTPNPLSASAPPNVQRVNAEQPSSNNFSSTAFLPQSPETTGNLPLNFGAPEGAPLAITPFVTSPELERLITQTTVEAAAVIPGDNDVSRQLYLRKHVQLRLLNLIAGQTDRALQPIPGVDSADQEFWQQMLWGLANYFDTQGMPDSSERATQTINQLRIAATRLQEKARLELHNVAFCHKISGYGNYQRFKRDEFTAGQPVLLYAEVADFKSEPTPDGQFRTLMKSTLEVLEGGPTGRLVESLPLSPSEDRCRNQRRDYYHSYEFTIPQSCNPGPHTLQLRVEDQLGKKTAITRLNFTVQ